MLLQRVLTAIPLGILIIWIILFQSSEVFFWMLIFITAVAGYEWGKLSGLPAAGRIIYLMLLCAVCWLVKNPLGEYIHAYVYAGVAWWFVTMFILLRLTPKAASSTLSPGKLIAGLVVIPAAMLAMYALHTRTGGPEWLLYGLMLVWVADTGAYFSGRRFGRNKLAPAISPGKTREGVLGAMVLVTVYSIMAAYYFSLDLNGTLYLLLLAAVLTLVSVAGDLYESVLKRERGVKDSGKILPGHGGALDRIDSMLAAMPVFAVGHELLLQPVFKL
jgi:phosphatidate cytidylyltransferase